jgi:hypothetical protein
VLHELVSSGKLALIRELVVVHTCRSQEAQSLGAVLNLLSASGYRYLIHDLDAQSNPVSKPPFRIKDDSAWTCLIYARRETEDPKRPDPRPEPAKQDAKG